MNTNQVPSDWDRLELLFEAAVALPPAEREGFLNREGCSPELRAELESLLARAEPAGRLFGAMAAALPALEPSDHEVPSPSDPLAGRCVGHYLIMERIGGGGMGVLYRARDTRLEREVALKFLPPHLGLDPSAKERFLVEGRAAAALDHPDICTVHEIGEMEDGHLFIAMACYDGETLKDRIARGPLPVTEAVALAVRIARALAAAHDHGIVHRDVKPANVMLTRDGGVKLLDFGLAKVADVTLTLPGSTLGTAAYMSPEQVRAEPVDRRSDLWSLGVVLYEMLAGMRPFRGGTDAVIVDSVLHQDPEPVESLRPETPVPVARAVARLLQKDPDDRYPSAERLVAELGEAARGEPTARRMAPPLRALARLRRRPARLAVAVVVMGLGASLLARRAFEPEPPTDPMSVAVLPFEYLGGDPGEAYFSAGITNDIITQLSAIRSLTVVSRTSALAYEGERRNRREIAGELGVARILEGTVQRDGGRVRITVQLIDAASDRHLWAESYDRETGDIFAIQTDVARRVAGALEATLTPGEERRLARAPTDDPAAHDLYLKGRFVMERRTPEALRQAITYFRRAIGRDSSFAAAWAGVADAYVLLFTRDALSREAAADSAIAPARRALTLDEELADAHVAMGLVQFLNREWGGQLESFRRAAELNPSHAFAHHNLGHRAAFVEGRLDDALRHVRRAVRLDPLAPVYSNHLAHLLYLSRDYEGAARQHRATEELDADFGFGARRARWTILLAVAGRFEEARRVVDTALERQPEDPRLLAALAILRARRGESREARAALERAMAAGADSISVGRVYAALREPERALAYLSASFEDFSVIKILAWDPLLDPLRSDPRFAALLERVAGDWKLPHLPTSATSVQVHGIGGER